MGVKNNFSQAVSELMGISKTAEQDKKEEREDVNEAESLVGTTEDRMIEEDTESMDELEKGTDQVENGQKEASVYKAGQNPKERIMAMLAQQQQGTQQIEEAEADDSKIQSTQPAASTKVPSQRQQMKEPPGATTIAKGTVIVGEINAEGDVELLGSVKGKVASRGDIRANGKVVGDLAGKDIDLIACAVQGNIVASGSVTVDENSVVIGDVKSENFCLDGRIKGNVTVENEAKFQPKAILAGNVTTASIAMSQGAKIQGEVNIPLSEKETNITFDVDIEV